jgi:hypothetical protein
MGDHVEFKGKTAYLNFIRTLKSREDKTLVTKYQLSFESLADLELLLTMNHDEMVLVDGKQISYGRFREEILMNTHRIYTSKDGKFLDDVLTIDIPSSLENITSHLNKK